MSYLSLDNKTINRVSHKPQICGLGKLFVE